MDKIAFTLGYLEKLGAPGDAAKVFKTVVQNPGLLVGLPTAAAYGAGRVLGNLQEPAAEDLNVLQADYVKRKLEQAISDLERKRHAEALRKEHVGHSASLRI